ncbi:MAG TPA: methyltransferase [Acidisphaera sp.]|nr:methyltransferase [Acidisphaera sp.]HME28120.1 methyltransferase [Acetobacteraceae bacterium]
MSGEPSASQPAEVSTPDTIQRLQSGVGPALAMLAGMQLEVFTQLADGPLPAAEIASRLGVAEDRLARLLYALVVAGLLAVRGGAFANTPEAATFLVRGRPRYIGGLHELLSQLWDADLRTARSIRSGEPAALHDFAAMDDGELAAMLRGMHANAIASGADLARRFDFTACASVVDIGGGSGGVIAALCDAHPSMRGVLFDLPRTAALAAPILRDTRGAGRVTIEAGDILAAPPAGTHDAAVMGRVVQTFSRDDAARAITNAAASVRPGGAVYILGGGILDDNRLGPFLAVYLNVTFVNLYRAGEAYTEAEHAAWLATAGCGEVQRITLPTGGGIIRATKLS